MDFRQAMELAARAFEVVGVAILLAGSAGALLPFAREVLRRRGRHGYEIARQDLGRAILLGLEILIIADIIKTITVELTLESAATLGLIVAVRTFLSFSLGVELAGTLPWRQAAERRGSQAEG